MIDQLLVAILLDDALTIRCHLCMRFMLADATQVSVVQPLLKICRLLRSSVASSSRVRISSRVSGTVSPSGMAMDGICWPKLIDSSMFRHHRPATASERNGLSNTGTPLIRIGFPVFDRHHHHRYPVWGYQGAMNALVWILDKIFDERAESRREPLCRF